jgi:uncharacterized membrane protein
MLPNPLHPAIVHFPIVLMILLPISAAVALWAIGRGTRPLMAWAVPAAFAAALALSSWAALETGGDQAEAVEGKATEQYVEQHEESAELFLGLSVGVLALVTAGFTAGRVGKALRLTATAASAALIVAGYQVGHTGGALVYTHGIGPAAAGTVGVVPAVRSER